MNIPSMFSHLIFLIKALMELGVIKSQGEGRATYYVLDCVEGTPSK
jgi:hypothetical protein